MKYSLQVSSWWRPSSSRAECLGSCTNDRALLLAGNYGDRASKIKVRCKTFVDCVPSSVLPSWVWINFFLVFFQVEMWPNNSTGREILPTLSDIPTELQNRPGAALLGMCQHRLFRMSSLVLCCMFSFSVFTGGVVYLCGGFNKGAKKECYTLGMKVQYL